MAIEYNISIRATWEELHALSPEQCAAFMNGCAEVLSASPYRESASAGRENNDVTQKKEKERPSLPLKRPLTCFDDE